MRPLRLIAGLLLLLALQLGQIGLVLHQAHHDLDGHDGACETCLHASPLEQLARVADLPLPPPAPGIAPPPVAPVAIQTTFRCHYRSRAPPLPAAA